MGYLLAVIGALKRGPLLAVHGISKVYETAPVEGEGEQPDYLNCVVAVEYSA